MAKQRSKRRKHIPQRTCVGCRTVAPKRSLIRITHRANQIHIDPTGKLPGRGAYLHNRRSCWQRGLRNGKLNHALRKELTAEDVQTLITFMQTLPEEQSIPGGEGEEQV